VYNVERIVSGHGEKKKNAHAQNCEKGLLPLSFLLIRVSACVSGATAGKCTRNLIWGLLRVSACVSGPPAGAPLSCERLQI
jgi:hypothetical protein